VSYGIKRADTRSGLPMKPTAKSGFSKGLLAAKTRRKTRIKLRPMENSYPKHNLTNTQFVFLCHTKYSVVCLKK
jgi:hypothetical protein